MVWNGDTLAIIFLLAGMLVLLLDLAFDGLEAFMEEGAEVGCGVA